MQPKKTKKLDISLNYVLPVQLTNVLCNIRNLWHVVFFFYGNEHLDNKHKKSHLAPWLLWVPGIPKGITNN